MLYLSLIDEQLSILLRVLEHAEQPRLHATKLLFLIAAFTPCEIEEHNPSAEILNPSEH
jgi:hypothetical protein